MLDDYVRRIQRVTGVEGEISYAVTPVPYPAPRELVLDLRDFRVGMLDFFKFHECDMLHLISERNSGLGKVMPISRRFAYEVEFLREAEKCRHNLAPRDRGAEFAKLLQWVVERKRTDMPKLYWNATFGSPEMRKTFTLSSEPISTAQDAAYVNSRQALEYFGSLGDALRVPSPSVDIGKLEAHNFALQLHQFGGRIVSAMAELTAHLNGAAHSLETLVARGPVCYEGNRSSKASILHNVFRTRYVQRVGPYLSRVHRQGEDWLVAVNKLVNMQEVQIPSAFRDYSTRMLSLSQENGLWKAFERSIARHTEAWRYLLRQCGMEPRSSS